MTFLTSHWPKIIGGIALFLLILWLARCDAYRDGVRDTDQAWKVASERLVEKAQKSGQRADVNAAERATEYRVGLEQEKEKVDQAVEAGADPFGELFPKQDQTR